VAHVFVIVVGDVVVDLTGDGDAFIQVAVAVNAHDHDQVNDHAVD